jgi:hypothetical protein
MAERKRDMQRRDKEVQEELESTSLACVYCNQNKDNFRETSKIVEEKCNDVEKKNLLTCFCFYKMN